MIENGSTVRADVLPARSVWLIWKVYGPGVSGASVSEVSFVESPRTTPPPAPITFQVKVVCTSPRQVNEGVMSLLPLIGRVSITGGAGAVVSSVLASRPDLVRGAHRDRRAATPASGPTTVPAA